MSEDPAPSAADKLKQALAAKKAKAGGGFDGSVAARAQEKVVAARNAALAKPAFRRASKRG